MYLLIVRGPFFICLNRNKNVNSGFPFYSRTYWIFKLTSRSTPIYLDGSTQEGKGYVMMNGTDSEFLGHDLDS